MNRAFNTWLDTQEPFIQGEFNLDSWEWLGFALIDELLQRGFNTMVIVQLKSGLFTIFRIDHLGFQQPTYLRFQTEHEGIDYMNRLANTVKEEEPYQPSIINCRDCGQPTPEAEIQDFTLICNHCLFVKYRIDFTQ